MGTVTYLAGEVDNPDRLRALVENRDSIPPVGGREGERPSIQGRREEGGREGGREGEREGGRERGFKGRMDGDEIGLVVQGGREAGLEGGSAMAAAMHSTESRMWMKARVCPPVP